MSGNSQEKKDGSFVIPEEFSFGLEERDEPEAAEADALLRPGVMAHGTVDLPDLDVDPEDCRHRWEERPPGQQTLAAEDKLIWVCPRCGSTTITYSWQKP